MEKKCTLEIEGNRDSKKLIRLYRDNYDAIFRYCMHRLFHRHIAEDVTSQVFLKAVENIHRFNGDEKGFRCWLYKIAANAVNNHLRKTIRRANLAGQKCLKKITADFNEPDDKMVLLREALHSLKPRYQTIITLRFFEKMRIEEIAELTSSSSGTVRSRLSRAIAKLRKKMNIDDNAFQEGGK